MDLELLVKRTHRPGDQFRPLTVSEDLAADFEEGYFEMADHAYQIMCLTREVVYFTARFSMQKDSKKLHRDTAYLLEQAFNTMEDACQIQKKDREMEEEEWGPEEHVQEI